MKKLTTIALFSILLCGAFLNTGCTLDYKGDAGQIQKRTDKLETAVASLNEFKTLAQAQIDKNTAELSVIQPLVNALEDRINELSSATEFAIATLALEVATDIDRISSTITSICGRIAELELAAQKAKSDIEELVDQVAALYGRVRSIVAVPATIAEFKHLEITGVDTCDIFEGLFEIAPADAAKAVKASDLTLVVREGVTKAVTYLDIPVVDAEVSEDGMIAVKAISDKLITPAAGNKLYYSLEYKKADSASDYTITSDFVPASALVNVPVSYVLSYYGEKKTAKFESTDSVDYSALAPVKLFQGFEPMFVIGEDNLTLSELSEYLHLVPAPSAVFKDSIVVADAPFKCDTANLIFNFDTKGFSSKQLINKTGQAVARVWVGGKYFGLDATKNIRIWKHNQLLEPMSSPQVIQWSYVNSTAVNYTAKKVQVPTVVFDSHDVTLGTTKIFKSADPAQKSVSGSVTVSDIATASGKTTATVAISGVAPGKNEVDYTFIQNASDDTLNLIAQIPFTVMPRPLDKEDLVLSDTVASYLTAGFNVAIAPIQAALTASDTTEYFAGLAAGSIMRNLDSLKTACAATGVATVKALRIDGTEIKTADISKYISGITLAYNPTTKKESTTISFKKEVKANNVCEIKFDIKAFGVTYTFAQRVVVSDVPFKLATDPLFVKDGIVTVRGIVNNSNKYLIEDINLLNYIRLDGAVPSAETGVKAHFSLFNELGKTGKDDEKGIKNLPNSPSAKSVSGSTISGPVNIQWKNAGDYTATRMIVKSWLTNSANNVIGDTLFITIQTPVPVKNFDGGQITADRIKGQNLEINMWKDMFASSCLADTNIFNPKAETLTEAQVKSIDYGQIVEFNWSKVTAELNGSPYTLDPNYFTENNGVLSVNKECGQFTAPLKITVPVVCKHYLDYDHKKALESTVVITINQK